MFIHVFINKKSPFQKGALYIFFIHTFPSFIVSNKKRNKNMYLFLNSSCSNIDTNKELFF